MIIGLSLIFLLVYNNELVITGARNGLMLWYTSVLPLLLPFMLISGYIVDCSAAKNKSTNDKSSYKKNALTTILLGIFCGYPIGAKCTADYVVTGRLSILTGNLILPLCNNLSPMFLSGYVCSNILKNKISFFKLLFLLYLPYIFYVIILLAITHLRQKNISQNFEAYTTSPKASRSETDNSRILSSIIQITTIGVYIMICSIIISFIANSSTIPHAMKPIMSAATEVSSGIHFLAASDIFSENKKTALILAATSFGGISSILQTNCVIKNSGLSIVNYIIAKLICSTATYYLAMLIQ